MGWIEDEFRRYAVRPDCRRMRVHRLVFAEMTLAQRLFGLRWESQCTCGHRTACSSWSQAMSLTGAHLAAAAWVGAERGA